MSIRGHMPPAGGQTTGMGGWIVVVIAAIVAAGVSPASARADVLIYSYDGNVFPFDDDSANWRGSENTCAPPCTETLEDGHLVLTWGGGDQVNYTLDISNDLGEPPLPESLWVEWNFRSDNVFSSSPSCDAAFVVRYDQVFDLVNMHGDTAISFEGGDVVSDLNINEFHTYRFESPDGVNSTFSVDGRVFFTGSDIFAGGAFLQMLGQGGCGPNPYPNHNEWDFVRYGTINTGERIVMTDPPRGFLDPTLHAGLDRFTVTFDQPNYVYIDHITVTVSEGVAPVVIQTRRLDNGHPETVQIVLDRPLPLDTVIRFDFLENDQVTDSVIYGQAPPIPAISTWGVIVTLLAILTLGTFVFHRRVYCS